MNTPLPMPHLRDLTPYEGRCVMPLNDAPSLQETRICGKPATTHRHVANLTCGFCAECAAGLDSETIEDAAACGLALVFNSASIGSETDFGAFYDRKVSVWTSPRYEVIDVERKRVLHRAVTREDAIGWLIPYMDHDDAAN